MLPLVGIDVTVPGGGEIQHHRAARCRDLDEGLEVGKQSIDFDHLWKQRLLSDKGEQPTGQRDSTVRGRHGIGHASRGNGVGGQQASAPVEIADDDAQQDVEVVHQAAGELAQRFRLLGLTQALGAGNEAGCFGNERLETLQRRPSVRDERRRSDDIGISVAHRTEPFEVLSKPSANESANRGSEHFLAQQSNRSIK